MVELTYLNKNNIVKSSDDKQVCISKYKHEWLKVMQAQMDSLLKNNTWLMVKRQVNQKVI